MSSIYNVLLLKKKEKKCAIYTVYILKRVDLELFALVPLFGKC